MTASKKLIRILIALVWLINGLFCKLLNLVPRHELIVARIVGEQYSPTLTPLIGISEIFIAFWVVSGKMAKLCALIQIILIATMNILEFLIAPDLLLFGRANSILAVVLILSIYFNELHFSQKNRATAPH